MLKTLKIKLGKKVEKRLHAEVTTRINKLTGHFRH